MCFASKFVYICNPLCLHPISLYLEHVNVRCISISTMRKYSTCFNVFSYYLDAHPSSIYMCNICKYDTRFERCGYAYG